MRHPSCFLAISNSAWSAGGGKHSPAVDTVVDAAMLGQVAAESTSKQTHVGPVLREMS